jgi:hypothetical protein
VVAVVVVAGPAGRAGEDANPDREVEEEAEEGEERDQEEGRAHVTPQAVGPGGSYLTPRKGVKPSICIIALGSAIAHPVAEDVGGLEWVAFTRS